MFNKFSGAELSYRVFHVLISHADNVFDAKWWNDISSLPSFFGADAVVEIAKNIADLIE